jgi:hypothetical protein
MRSLAEEEVPDQQLLQLNHHEADRREERSQDFVHMPMDYRYTNSGPDKSTLGNASRSLQ